TRARWRRTARARMLLCRARARPRRPVPCRGSAVSARGASPRVRRLHRVAGLVLALPILAWAATGVLFHVKPGWGPAYAALELPLEPLEPGTALAPLPRAGAAGAPWLESRRLRTVLGE